MRHISNELRSTIFVVVLAIGFSAALLAQSQQKIDSEKNKDSLSVFVMERAKTHLGEGAAISPDGHLFAYIGDDNSLHVRDLNTGQDRMLLSEVGPGLDVFAHPTFSPDETRIVFSASGGTRYYPSDIYSINTRGSDLVRLTHSKALSAAEKNNSPLYSEYFYSAQYAPNGKKLMLRLYDPIRQTDQVALTNTNGENLEIIGEGVPLYWSNDGEALYYTKDNSLTRYLLKSKEKQINTRVSVRILGKLIDADGFVVDDGNRIATGRIEDAFSSNAATPLDIPRVRSSSRQKVKDAEELALTSIQFSVSGRSLRIYEGQMTERYEIVDSEK